jgi:chaperonin GroEL
MSTTPKEIIFEEQARDLLLKGIKKLTNVVAFTLGPKGRNVGLDKSWGAPTITNDGASIIRDIQLKDKYENMGVAMAKEVVQKIKEKCGDGTTTGTILLCALVESGIKNIASGASPIGLKRGMDKAVEAIIEVSLWQPRDRQPDSRSCRKGQQLGRYYNRRRQEHRNNH